MKHMIALFRQTGESQCGKNMDAVFEISKSLLSESRPELLDKTLLDELTQLKRLIEIPKLGSDADSESSTAALKKELVEASEYFTSEQRKFHKSMTVLPLGQFMINRAANCVNCASKEIANLKSELAVEKMPTLNASGGKQEMGLAHHKEFVDAFETASKNMREQVDAVNDKAFFEYIGKAMKGMEALLNEGKLSIYV